MNSREFCYWLQGCFELNGPHNGFTGSQVDCIKNHLAMVFKHEIDPSYKDSVQLNIIHNGAALHTISPSYNGGAGPPANFNEHTTMRC